MRKATGSGVFALLIPTLASAQPEVREILKQISDTYKSTSQYELSATATAHEASGRTDAPIRMHFAFKAPDRYRVEGVPLGAGDSSELGEAVIVNDGATVWLYFRKANEYGSVADTQLTADAADDLGDLAPNAMDQFMMWRYRGAAGFTEARFLREETVEFGGTQVGCYVLTVSQKKDGVPYTWWVDKQQHRILREDNPGSSTVFTAQRRAITPGSK
jgi:outer membrane lipoprotein-sorting protein